MTIQIGLTHELTNTQLEARWRSLAIGPTSWLCPSPEVAFLRRFVHPDLWLHKTYARRTLAGHNDGLETLDGALVW